MCLEMFTHKRRIRIVKDEHDPCYCAFFHDHEHEILTDGKKGETPAEAVGSLALVDYGYYGILNLNQVVTFEENLSHTCKTIQYSVSVSSNKQPYSPFVTIGWYDSKEKALGTLILKMPKFFSVIIDNHVKID